MPRTYDEVDPGYARRALRRAVRVKQRIEQDTADLDVLIFEANRGGVTYDELRDALGVSRTTVTNAINRARDTAA
jgi:uncharacterized membrane protein